MFIQSIPRPPRLSAPAFTFFSPSRAPALSRVHTPAFSFFSPFRAPGLQSFPRPGLHYFQAIGSQPFFSRPGFQFLSPFRAPAFSFFSPFRAPAFIFSLLVPHPAPRPSVFLVLSAARPSFSVLSSPRPSFFSLLVPCPGQFFSVLSATHISHFVPFKNVFHTFTFLLHFDPLFPPPFACSVQRCFPPQISHYFSSFFLVFVTSLCSLFAFSVVPSDFSLFLSLCFFRSSLRFLTLSLSFFRCSLRFLTISLLSSLFFCHLSLFPLCFFRCSLGFLTLSLSLLFPIFPQISHSFSLFVPLFPQISHSFPVSFLFQEFPNCYTERPKHVKLSGHKGSVSR